MSPRKRRIDPEEPQEPDESSSAGAPSAADEPTSRRARRKAARAERDAEPAAATPDPSADLAAALAAITGSVGDEGAGPVETAEPVWADEPATPTEPTPPEPRGAQAAAPDRSRAARSAAAVGGTAAEEEIASLTRRHAAARATESPAPIAPGMRAFRWPALLVVVALLVGAALVERRDLEPVTVDAAPADLNHLMPVASAPDARSSTFYCAGGTARGSTDPVEPAQADESTTTTTSPEGPPGTTEPGTGNEAPQSVPIVAEQTVLVGNLSDRDQQVTVTAVPSEGDPVSRTTTVAARTRSSVKLSDLVTAPFVSALVETDGGSIAVDHEVEGPTGRAIAPCASSASSTWYFPSGTTRGGTRHVYSVFNPFPQQTVVDFSFMVEDEGGRQTVRRSDQLEGIVVPPDTVVAVDITDIITVRNQVATTVRTRSGQGRVIVDQLEASEGRDEWPEDLSLTLGAPAPASTWLFADNQPLADGVATSFVAFNPGTTDAELEISVEVDGQLPSTVIEPFVVTVRAGQYAVVPIGDDTRIPRGFGAFVVAVSRNDVPVVVERVMTQQEPADPDGVAYTMGAPAVARDWLVPVGGVDGQEAMQVSIANPSVSEQVTLTVEAVGEGDAASLEQFDHVTLAPGARTVVDLSDAQGAASLMLRVTASGAVVVGQWFAFDDPGTLSDTVAFPVAGTLALPGGEITDRGTLPEVAEPPPFDGTLPEGTVPGTTPGTAVEPPGTDVPPESTTTTTAAPPETDPATGAPIDPAAGAPDATSTTEAPVAPG